MTAILSILIALPGVPPKIEARFEQVHPLPRNSQVIEPSPGRARAVILVPGLRYHPLHGTQVQHAEFHSWQKPGSPVVSELAKSADVFAFSYSQNADLETISAAPALEQAVNKLRFLGYQEIVLIGHSAGGILVRLFVEDHPQAGVAKVVQVCAPNLGSSWGEADISVHNLQEQFIESLTRTQRRAACQQRGDKRIPAHVQFVCVVGGGHLGDGLVSRPSQWPDDLQAQGIPAIHLSTTHFTVMHTQKTARALAELAAENHPRWSKAEVEAARKRLFDPAIKLRLMPIKK